MKDYIKEIEEYAKICADCGNCLQLCPVYNAELREPDSPRGKVNLIKELIKGNIDNNKLNRDFVYRCVLCGSCEYVCTRGINYIDIMIRYRNLISKEQKIPKLKKFVLFFYRKEFLRFILPLTDILERTFVKRILPLPKRLKKIKLKIKKDKNKEYDILIFPGCVLSNFYPDILVKIKNFFEKKGKSVVIPNEFDCCGFPHLSQGWGKKFDKLKEKNINVLKKYKFKHMVIPCGTGVMTFKKYYNIEDLEVFELTEYIYRYFKDVKVNIERYENINLSYHHPCHTAKSLGIKEEPEFFLSKLGDNFKKDDSMLCCGFGGLFSIGYPSTSNKILDKRVKTFKDMGLDTVLTSCPGCFFQLREKTDLNIQHIIDLFD